MIIWRGWGILAVAFFIASGVLGIGVPFGIWGESAKWAMIPIGLAAAAGCWFTGIHLNITRPQRILEQEVPRMRAQVAAAVENGTFRLVNQPPPASLADARAQASVYLRTAEHSLSLRRNQHTLFFIPLQYWAFLIAAWSVATPLLIR